MNLIYPPFGSKLKGLLLLAMAHCLFFSANARPNNFNDNDPATVCSLCNIPSTLYVLTATPSQATLMWDVAFNACSYTTRLREQGTATWTHIGTVTSNAAVVSGLSPGKNYEWQVRTNCCDSTYSGYAAVSYFTTPLPCTNPIPTGLASANVLSNSAKLSWTAVTGATGYVLKYRVQGASNWQSTNVTTNSYTLNGLTPSTTYEFQVSTYANSCIGDPSTSATFITPALPTCGMPTTPTIVSVTPTSCCIQWGAVSQVCSYAVRCRIVGTNLWTYTQLTATNQICIPNLVANTNYECQVAANCCNGAIGNFTNFLVINTSTNCAAPSNSVVSNITATTAQICWTGASSASGYKVEYKPTTSSVWTAVNASTTCTTLYGLSPTTAYHYRITTLCSGSAQSTPCATYTFTTTTLSTCGIPSKITCSNATASGFTVNWPAVSGACSYYIRMRVLGATSWSFSGALTSNKATVSGAASNTVYEFQVQSVCCSGGTSDFSVLTTCQTTGFCSTPTNISFSNITNTTALVSWVAASGATSYTVQYKTNAATAWTSVNATSTSVTLYGLSANTAYQVQVLANCPNNCVSTPSTIGTFTTTNITNICNVPTNCTFSNLTTSSCSISWAAVSGACSYIVRVRVQGATTWAATGNPTKNSANLTGLSPNTTYEWQVLTVCCSGTQSDYCPLQIVSTSNACATPSNVIATNVTTSSATLSWTAISGALSYTVSYKTAAEITWNTLTSNSNSLLIANLLPNTTYQYFVKTNCSATSQSGASTTCTFTTGSTSSCQTPTGLTVQNISTSSATLSWIASPNACSYKVRYRAKGSTTWVTLTAANNSLVLSNLSTATNYEWNVMSVCCNGSFSVISTTQIFATNSACLSNDEPCTPSILTVGDAWSCVNGSNICASGSNIAAPSGCNYAPNDVWYKMVMPASGFVTIAVCASPGMNPGVAVYSNNGCSSLNYLGCKYAVNSGGNIGSVAQISLQGPAGYSVWVRVWGGDNTTGTFSICAINKVVCSTNAAPTANNRTNNINTDVTIKAENNTILFENSTIVLAPNPASSTVNVRFDATTAVSQAKIVVYDMQGKKVIAQNIEVQKGENEARLSVEELNTGAYILRIEGRENFTPSRLMVQK